MKPRIPQFIPPSAKKRIKKKLVPAEEWDKQIQDKYVLVDPEKEQKDKVMQLPAKAWEEDSEDDKLAESKVLVRVTKGIYAGTEFYFGTCQLLPEQEDGQTPIKFEYTVTKKPAKVKTETQTFIDFAGDILHHLFEAQLKSGTLKWEQKEEKDIHDHWDEQYKDMKGKPKPTSYEGMVDEVLGAPIVSSTSAHWDPKTNKMVTTDDVTGENVENEPTTGQGTEDHSSESSA